MTALYGILVLGLVGFLMLAAEVFVPGLVLGIMGLLALAGAIVLAFAAYGPLTGTIALAGISLTTLTGFIVWMSIFPRTAIGRRIMLRDNLAPGYGTKKTPNPELVGRHGSALTPLRPSGTALIEGRKVDVVAENAFITKGTAVQVVLQEGLRVVVREV